MSSSIVGVWVVAHTLPPDVHIGGLLPVSKGLSVGCPSTGAGQSLSSRAARPQALVRKLRVYN